ncbi:hypothetical protein GCM10022215_31180 [Nocardioides fonticola]|uniref:Cyclic nucleotide-binding domain-containing protein n=1 Tax=Nocardioides fonticola TaxID=450363 RepID=A0ABP7XR22_9ACTN
MSRTRIDTLRRLAPFSGCSDKELRRLDSLLDQAEVPAGKQLTAVGQHGTQAFVIVEGAAEARIGERHLASFGPGDVIGEMALLDRRASRVATVVTTAPTTVLVMDPRSFESVMAQFPSVARHIATVLAQRLRLADTAPASELAG